MLLSSVINVQRLVWEPTGSPQSSLVFQYVWWQYFWSGVSFVLFLVVAAFALLVLQFLCYSRGLSLSLLFQRVDRMVKVRFQFTLWIVCCDQFLQPCPLLSHSRPVLFHIWYACMLQLCSFCSYCYALSLPPGNTNWGVCCRAVAQPTDILLVLMLNYDATAVGAILETTAEPTRTALLTLGYGLPFACSFWVPMLLTVLQEPHSHNLWVEHLNTCDVFWCWTWARRGWSQWYIGPEVWSCSGLKQSPSLMILLSCLMTPARQLQCHLVFSGELCSYSGRCGYLFFEALRWLHKCRNLGACFKRFCAMLRGFLCSLDFPMSRTKTSKPGGSKAIKYDEAGQQSKK